MENIRKIYVNRELSDKEKLLGIPSRVLVEIPASVVENLNEADSHVLLEGLEFFKKFNYSELPGLYDTDLDLLGVHEKVIEKYKEAISVLAKVQKRIIEYVKSLGDELLIIFYRTKKIHFSDLVLFDGTIKKYSDLGYVSRWVERYAIDFDCPELSEVKERAESLIEEEKIKRENEKKKDEEERKKREEKRRRIEKERHGLCISLLDEIDSDRFRSDLLHESEMKGILFQHYFREIFDAMKMFRRAFEVFDEGGIEIGHNCGCPEYSRYSTCGLDSMKRPEFIVFSRLLKKIEETNREFPEIVKFEATAREFYVECDVCGEIAVEHIPAVRITLIVGDWDISRLYLFRVSETSDRIVQ